MTKEQRDLGCLLGCLVLSEGGGITWSDEAETRVSLEASLRSSFVAYLC